jgi:hypothetical protein
MLIITPQFVYGKSKDTEGMCLSVEIGNSRYLFVDGLASICGAESSVVVYGGEKFVGKNVSK